MFDRKIYINLNEKNFAFSCNMCKSFKSCKGAEQCKLLEYISARLPNVYFTLNQNKPNIIIKSDNMEQAETIILRAIKLRNINRIR